MNPETESKPERLRVFVALEASESVRAALADTQAQCLSHLPVAAAIKWARPEQFHLTLRFLGSIERVVLPELNAKLRAACSALSPMDLRCAGLGLFPERGRPRVLWAGIDAGRANQLADTFQSIALATRGFGQEEKIEKSFTGHITLARFKEMSRSEAGRLRGLVQQFSGREFGRWRATEIQVVQSQLSPKGSQYSVLERVRLGRA